MNNLEIENGINIFDIMVNVMENIFINRQV